MPTCVDVCTRALCVGGLAALSVLGGLEVARADECRPEPSHAAAPGAHWAYYTDRATNRKCWYLVDPGAPTAVAAPPRAAVAPRAAPAPEPSPYDPAPPFGSFFSWWTGGPRNPSPPQPEPATGDPRAAGGPRLDPDARADPRIDARPRPPRPASATEAALAPKPHRPAPTAAAPVARADAQPQARLTPTERDALFREFLHWQEQQKPQ